MFPLSQPALCLDSRGVGVEGRRVFVCMCVGGDSTLEQRVRERKEGAAEGGGKSQTSREQRRRNREGDGEACFSKSH